MLSNPDKGSVTATQEIYTSQIWKSTVAGDLDRNNIKAVDVLTFARIESKRNEEERDSIGKYIHLLG